MTDVVVGLDNGGTCNNATVLTLDGRWLVEGMAETPSRVEEGTEVVVAALVASFESMLGQAAVTERWFGRWASIPPVRLAQILADLGEEPVGDRDDPLVAALAVSRTGVVHRPKGP